MSEQNEIIIVEVIEPVRAGVGEALRGAFRLPETRANDDELAKLLAEAR